MRKAARIIGARLAPVVAALSVVTLMVWGVTWLAGAGRAEEALMELDQRRIDAHAARLAPSTPSEWKIVRYVVGRRVAWPGVWYYEGMSYTVDGPISDHTPRSLVLWYGVGATVAWQDKEWFPDRAARMRELAETGY